MSESDPLQDTGDWWVGGYSVVNGKMQALSEENSYYLQLVVAMWKQGLVLPHFPDSQYNLEMLISFYGDIFHLKKYCVGQTK